MSLNNKIEKSDLARDALYDKVNVIAEELDEKKQELLVAGENIKTINGESIVGSGNVEISGLNRNITNCITEIPQDIKLELTDGTLTLKAGSKVYVPNGSGVFDEVVIESDIVYTYTYGAYKLGLYYNKNSNSLNSWLKDSETSGTTVPSGDGTFYNTTTNKILRYIGGSISVDNLSFPIATITTNASQITSIDQIFNGFGYIGSTVFALPGVKGLIPNGRNEDGSLRNREVVVSSVKTITVNQYTYNIALYESGGLGLQTQNFKLNELENYNYDNTTKTIAMLAVNIAQSGGKITSFTSKLPFRAADQNELNEKVELKQDKATAVNYGNITNCITEIPQDIKLELTDGTLTLKAGSKVYVPNGKYGDGAPKFDEVVISKDYTLSAAWNDKRMLFIRHNSDTDVYIDTYPVGQCHSGSTPPTGSQWMFWYDTSSNILKRTSDSGTTWDNYYSFPICIYNSDNGGITSIDQVFNGFGYIGNTIFALPGVKMLVPRGRNEDGSLKNEERATSKVVINTNPGYVNNAVICLNDTSINSFYLGFTKPVFGWATYQEDENKNYLSTVETDYCFVGRLQGDSNKKITDFKPKLPFRAADQSSLNNFVLVSALPTNPDSNTFYFIPE